MLKLSFQRCGFVVIAWLASTIPVVLSLNIVVPGGTGKLGKILLPKLRNHDVTVLTRNSFLAAAPSRVTEVFGYLGKSFLTKYPHVTLRDWDGGDLLDIVGQDFLGWQEDALVNADVVVHLVGGYTQQREMATERLVRESLRVNPQALQITVNLKEEDIPRVTPGMVTAKVKRIQDCESMVRDNCLYSKCLRLEANRDEEACEQIHNVITSWKTEQQSGEQADALYR
jgi:hypothetical protein